MGDLVFVDANVLVYARDASEADKQPRAADWLDRLWRTHRGRVSAQVLSEFYVVVTEKLNPGLERAVARRDAQLFSAWRPLPVDENLLRSGWVIQERFRISWWDALIVAAALAAGCTYLLTEDLQHGQRFGDTEVIDPFERSPDALGL